jgi:phosphate transport system protein
MARTEYQSSLDELRDDVLYMSEVVAERLRTGLDALERKDERLAREVIDGDDEVNDMYLDLEGRCIDLIALQQPVASDLRFIAASFKIITDLERIADLAVNLGGYTLEAERDLFPDVDIQRIGRATLEMLQMSMEAYAEQAADRCHDVADRDDEVDAMCERASELVVRDLIEGDYLADDDGDDRYIDGDAEIESIMQDVSRLLLTVRDLERVGDHAVNIAARTLYMVENDDQLLY